MTFGEILNIREHLLMLRTNVERVTYLKLLKLLSKLLTPERYVGMTDRCRWH